ncbi:hypothetical protein [Hymenobacter fodinae]|nr:hypothetical protein [Hymenobacter fodinae]
MQWLTDAKTYLSTPDWRNTLFLLLLLGLLSGWRLRRQWRQVLY